MSDILNQFRDEELPMSTVDISAAVRQGRRRRRTRTVLTTAAVVVAVAAAGATAPLWLSGSNPVPPADPTCGVPSPARPALPDWQRFDPLTLEIDASGVTGYRVIATATSAHYQIVGLDGDTSVSVTLYTCGVQPQSLVHEFVLVDPTAGEPADPVHGVPAYWLPPNGPSDLLGLAWQWTAGAWAVVQPAPPEPGQTPMTRDELRTLAARVAEQVEFGAGTPVVAPFSLPAPTDMYLVSTLTFEDTEGTPHGFGVGFNRIATPEPTSSRGFFPDLWVWGNYFAAVDDLSDGTTPYPEDLGYPAYQAERWWEGRDSEVLLVFDFFGLGLEIEPRGIPGTMAEKMRFAADVFRTITAYDRQAWGDPVAD